MNEIRFVVQKTDRSLGIDQYQSTIPTLCSKNAPEYKRAQGILVLARDCLDRLATVELALSQDRFLRQSKGKQHVKGARELILVRKPQNSPEIEERLVGESDEDVWLHSSRTRSLPDSSETRTRRSTRTFRPTWMGLMGRYWKTKNKLQTRLVPSYSDQTERESGSSARLPMEYGNSPVAWPTMRFTKLDTSAAISFENRTDEFHSWPETNCTM